LQVNRAWFWPKLPDLWPNTFSGAVDTLPLQQLEEPTNGQLNLVNKNQWRN